MNPRSLISVGDLSASEVLALLDLAARVKAQPDEYRRRLAGKTLALIFQKSSTRTRVSFEVGMFQLGGQPLFLSGRDLQLGRGETIADTARVLSRYVDGIMARTFAHQEVVDLATYASIPVINGLTDDLHPCQALADFFTLQEVFGELKGRKLAYIGDGNNVAHSLLLGAPKLGMEIAVATPEGFEPSPQYLAQATEAATAAGTRIEVVNEPELAVSGAVAVYTDVWASMGQEDSADSRRQAFEGFTVCSELMSKALPEAIFLHCLPCHRGEEVTAEVADGPQSRIFDEAENRLHVQKAILLWLMAGERI
jgi:ornithine carbamoyltransferase